MMANSERKILFARAPTLRIIFKPCDKNGSTSIWSWLSELELNFNLLGAHKCDSLNISEKGARHFLQRDVMNISEAESYLDFHGDHMLFAITRNPYARILSAYKDKINRLVKKTMPGLYAYSVFRQILEGPSSWKNNKPALSHMRKMLPFPEFIDRLSVLGVEIDSHYGLQVNSMPPKIIPISSLFKLEALASGQLKNAIYAHIYSILGSEDFIDVPLPMLNPIREKPNYSRFYDESTMKAVAGLYQLDFDAFGYSSFSLPFE